MNLDWMLLCEAVEELPMGRATLVGAGVGIIGVPHLPGKVSIRAAIGVSGRAEEFVSGATPSAARVVVRNPDGEIIVESSHLLGIGIDGLDASKFLDYPMQLILPTTLVFDAHAEGAYTAEVSTGLSVVMVVLTVEVAR